jgi:hypothetical protein
MQRHVGLVDLQKRARGGTARRPHQRPHRGAISRDRICRGLALGAARWGRGRRQVDAQDGPHQGNRCELGLPVQQREQAQPDLRLLDSSGAPPRQLEGHAAHLDVRRRQQPDLQCLEGNTPACDLRELALDLRLDQRKIEQAGCAQQHGPGQQGNRGRGDEGGAQRPPMTRRFQAPLHYRTGSEERSDTSGCARMSTDVASNDALGLVCSRS